MPTKKLMQNLIITNPSKNYIIIDEYAKLFFTSEKNNRVRLAPVDTKRFWRTWHQNKKQLKEIGMSVEKIKDVKDVDGNEFWEISIPKEIYYGDISKR